MNEYLMMYNRKRFLINVNYLMSRENLEAEELEEKLGLSSGCIRETGNDEVIPSAEDLVRIAEYFSATPDKLLFSNLSDCSGSRRQISAFLEKITDVTENGELNWTYETAGYLNSLETIASYSSKSRHPLFEGSVVGTYCIDGCLEYVYSREARFNSRKGGKDTLIFGTCYNVEFCEGKKLYLMNCSSSTDSAIHYIEAWLVDKNGGKPEYLCGSDSSAEVIQLYNAVSAFLKDNTISFSARSTIATYLEGGAMSYAGNPPVKPTQNYKPSVSASPF